MSTSAIAVAETVIAKFHEEGEAITQLKLQKILYYIKGWSMVIEKQPRFTETLEAWDYGPLAYSVRQAYGRAGRGALLLEHEIFPADDLLLDTVIDVYGCHTAEQLLALTHHDAPWHEYYRFDQDRTPIPDEAIRRFFSGKDALKNPVHALFIDTYTVRKYGGAARVDENIPPPTTAQIAEWEASLSDEPALVAV